MSLLSSIDRHAVRIGKEGLEGISVRPVQATGLVIFAHGSGSGRLSPRNQYVANSLQKAGLATLLLDLLQPVEEQNRENVFDIELLASRLVSATGWARGSRELGGLKSGD